MGVTVITMSYRDQIKELVQKNPKSYTKKIVSNEELRQWVENNTLSTSDSFKVRLYSAVYQESDVCFHGSKKKLKRWNEGFKSCGTIENCSCAREKHRKNTEDGIKNKRNEDIAKEKRKKTMFEKYGVEYNSQRKDIRHRWTKPKIDLDKKELLNNKEWLEKEYKEKDRSALDISHELGVYYSTVIDYCKMHGFQIKQTSRYSIVEKQICEFLYSLNVKVVTNDRSVLSGEEIDILIPDKNFGVEVNGLYWHSYSWKKDNEDRFRHSRKTQKARNNGIELIHLTDQEWHDKPEIIKSILQTKLRQSSNKISARNTKFEIIGSKQAREFLEENHLRGSCYSSYYYGLIHNNELVMVATFGKDRFNKNNKRLEMHRLCSKKYTCVVGGASKIIENLKRIFNNIEIITFCEKDLSNGRSYQNIGFEMVRETGPGYFWTDGNKVLSRYQCQKKNLSKWLENFDSEKSESKNMFDNGYLRYWNCGNWVLKY